VARFEWRRFRSLGAAAIALTITAGGAPPTITAATGSLYVSTEGDDANAGTTSDTAFRTLRQALRAATPGTTVRILPGTYVESVRREVIGEPGNPITIVGEGGRPVFSGGRIERYGLWLDQNAHVIVKNIEFRDYTTIGVLVVQSDDITLRRLRVRDNGFSSQIKWAEGYGILLDESSNLLVERNNVFGNGPNPRPFNMAGTGIDGYRMLNAVIRENRSHHNNGGGILVEDSVNVLVKRNTIYGNDLDVSADGWWDGGIWLDGGRDVTLVGNRIYTTTWGRPSRSATRTARSPPATS
jgi:nitrous oxidase accessory protein NosD